MVKSVSLTPTEEKYDITIRGFCITNPPPTGVILSPSGPHSHTSPVPALRQVAVAYRYLSSSLKSWSVKEMLPSSSETNSRVHPSRVPPRWPASSSVTSTW